MRDSYESASLEAVALAQFPHGRASRSKRLGRGVRQARLPHMRPILALTPTDAPLAALHGAYT
jgi:hypothetical protein